MESTTKRATIVGGSLTGLAAGILLRKIGWDVDIFERSPQSLSDRGAGIVMQQETLELLRLCGAKGDGMSASRSTIVSISMQADRLLRLTGCRS
jgi:2-polyprenyl-6-methoxyphenol hydroxylase-like FAD-dependent oxidoreductase